jgi:hypothetical protein
MGVVISLTLFGFGQSQANAAPVGALRAVEVEGNISSDTTWTQANSPYVVTDNLTVVPDITNTIVGGL